MSIALVESLEETDASSQPTQHLGDQEEHQQGWQQQQQRQRDVHPQASSLMTEQSDRSKDGAHNVAIRKLVARGQVGEVWVSGPGLAAGYSTADDTQQEQFPYEGQQRPDWGERPQQGKGQQEDKQQGAQQQQQQGRQQEQQPNARFQLLQLQGPLNSCVGPAASSASAAPETAAIAASQAAAATAKSASQAAAATAKSASQAAAATAKLLQKPPADDQDVIIPAARWFKTGDLGRLLLDGEFRINNQAVGCRD